MFNYYYLHKTHQCNVFHNYIHNINLFILLSIRVIKTEICCIKLCYADSISKKKMKCTFKFILLVLHY